VSFVVVGVEGIWMYNRDLPKPGSYSKHEWLRYLVGGSLWAEWKKKKKKKKRRKKRKRKNKKRTKKKRKKKRK
jgi:hypothetical protein